MAEMHKSLTVEWVDAGREPRAAPNPNFPKGVDIDLTKGAPAICQTALPYPAPRCGAYVIECMRCDQRALVTTAGRPDDPRSIKLACRSRTDSQAGQRRSRRSAPVRR